MLKHILLSTSAAVALTLSAPTIGTSEYTATYKNVIYHFSSEQSRDLLGADPSQYTPQYGGFFAFGITKARRSTLIVSSDGKGQNALV
ncbi:hypothetical protein [Methylophaga thalassica]|uniref:hypothetical protein n=1 Tax=Methylophaga aminisulfidivorans TaxID=230105 RepID=UPI003A94F5B0